MNYFTGALEDFRSPEEKEKDYYFNEIVASSNPVTWREKPQDLWRRFTIRDQDGSGSCVAQSMAKVLEVMWSVNHPTDDLIEFSASFIYQRRINKQWGDGQGMIGTDAFDIVRKHGTTLEYLMPSQMVNEAEINSVKESEHDRHIARAFRVDNYVQFVPAQSFEQVASTIQTTGKAVMVWFRFNYDEWTDIPTVKVKDPQLHHSVTAVDAFLYKGKKYLLIEDSWGKFGKFVGQRLISEEFFKARNTFCAYPINFRNEEDKKPAKPSYPFIVDLEFGQTNNHIVALQDILKYEGIFPTNVESTGYYGAITARAVLTFQKKHQVDYEAVLDHLGGKIVGPKTRAKLNELYK